MREGVNRVRGGRLMMALCLIVLSTACTVPYRVATDPVVDEVVVQVIPSAAAAYDHPVRLSASEMADLLREVRIQFTSHWLQRLITGPLDAVPLFDEEALARVGPALSEALVRAGADDRIVFYVAQRRASDRREVTSGTLFVKGQRLTLAVINHQNRVDVLPGLAVYDRQAPEVAVAPQHFSLIFRERAFVLEPQTGMEPQEWDILSHVLDADPPMVMVDYVRFLQYKSRSAAAPRVAPYSPSP